MPVNTDQKVYPLYTFSGRKRSENSEKISIKHSSHQLSNNYACHSHQKTELIRPSTSSPLVKQKITEVTEQLNHLALTNSRNTKAPSCIITYASLVPKASIPKPPSSRTSTYPTMQPKDKVIHMNFCQNSTEQAIHDPSTSWDCETSHVFDEESMSLTPDVTGDSLADKWIPVNRDQRRRGIITLPKTVPLETSTPQAVGKRKKNKKKQQQKKLNYLKQRSLSASSLKLKDDSSGSLADKKYDSTFCLNLQDFVKSPTAHVNSNHSKVVSQNPVLAPVPEFKPIGKVRERPKTKRPSRLKRSILKDREVRELQRCKSAPPIVNSQINSCTERPSDLSPVYSNRIPVVSEQNALQLYRPLSHNPMEWNPTQDNLIASLLQKLADYQDRAYTKYAHAPFHRNRSRRIVCGLREVIKHLRLKHTKFVFVARNLQGNASEHYRQLRAAVACDSADSPDIEAMTTLSPLERILVQIWTLALQSEPITPIMMTHTRKELARLCHKPHNVSVVGVLNVSGAEEIAKNLLALDSAINLPMVETEGAYKP